MLSGIRIYQSWLVGLGKRLFLVDGVGALLSAAMLGGVLAHFPEAVGMPRGTLLSLAGLATVFAVYSFGSYCWAGARWRPLLRLIAFVNLAYCGLTLALVCMEYNTLHWLGMVYFLLEIALILVLVGVELVAASRHSRL